MEKLFVQSCVSRECTTKLCMKECVCVKEGVWQRADEAEEEEEAAAAAAEEKAGCKIIKKNSTESCGAK